MHFVVSRCGRRAHRGACSKTAAGGSSESASHLAHVPLGTYTTYIVLPRRSIADYDDDKNRLPLQHYGNACVVNERICLDVA